MPWATTTGDPCDDHIMYPSTNPERGLWRVSLRPSSLVAGFIVGHLFLSHALREMREISAGVYTRRTTRKRHHKNLSPFTLRSSFLHHLTFLRCFCLRWDNKFIDNRISNITRSGMGIQLWPLTILPMRQEENKNTGIMNLPLSQNRSTIPSTGQRRGG